jgi:hypothetical protein
VAGTLWISNQSPKLGAYRGFAAAHSGKPLAYRSNFQYFFLEATPLSSGGVASEQKNPSAGKAEPFLYVMRQSREISEVCATEEPNHG